MPDKRTAEGVYQALSAISKEEGIDFGINEMTADAFKKKYFDKQESAGALYDKLNALSQEEGIDFGQGTRDEWMNSFDFKPRWKPTAAQRAQFERTMSSVRQSIDKGREQFDSKERRLRQAKSELREAYAERDRLQKMMDEKGKRLDKVIPTVSFGAGQAFTGGSIKRISDDEFNQLSAAYDDNHERIKTLEARVREEDSGAGTKYMKSAGAVVLDPRTWTNGLNSLKNDITKFGYKRLQEQGKSSEAGKVMMEHAQKKEEAEETYGQDLSFWHRAGNITGNMLPFALQIGLTRGIPIASKGVQLTGKIAGKIASPVLSRLTKYVGITASEMAQGLVVANTAGAANTASEVLKRHMGHVAKTEDGEYVFSGGESPLKAFVNGELTQMLEYGSEGLGEHLRLGSRSLKALDKMGASKVSDFFRKAGKNDIVKATGGLLNRFGIQGYPSEVMEEELNIIGNAILVGDKKISDLWDGKTQKDIWGGMALSLGFMGALPTAGYGAARGYDAYKYHRMEHGVETADRLAAFRLTEEAWQPLKERIDNTTNEHMKDVLEDIIGTDRLQREEKEAALEYVKRSMILRGYNMGAMANARDAAASGEMSESAAESYALDNSYTQGYNIVSPQEMNHAKTVLAVERQRVSGFASDDFLSAADANPYGALEQIRNADAWSDDERTAVLDYLNAKQTYDGMIQRVRDDIDGRIALSDAGVDARTNKTTGRIHDATMKQGDRKVYVVGGSVMMTDDGLMVDTGKSDERIVVRDAETGKLEMVSPTDIFRVEQAVDPAVEKERAKEEIRLRYAQEAADRIDGVANDTDGTGSVSEGANAPTQADESIRQGTAIDTDIPQYAINDAISIIDESGNPVRGTITADADADGRFEVYTESPVHGKLVNLFTRSELDNMLVEHKPAVEDTGAEERTEQSQVVEEQAAEVAPQQVQEPVQTVEPQPAQPAEAPAQPTEQPTAEPMPVGEDGEEDWQATTPERAHAYIFNEAGLSRSEGNEFIAAQTQAAQSALVKAKSAQMPRVGTSIKKYNEAKAKRQEKIDEAQRVLDYWQQVRNIQNDIQRVENERRAAEDAVRHDEAVAEAEAVERRKAESVQQDGTPPAVNNGSEDTGRSERSEEEIARLTHDEAITLIAQMEERADVAPVVELTIENWDALFGGDGIVKTPIGEVKMGENQFAKLMRQGRNGKLGMVKPTLESPDVIIEDAGEAKDGNATERNSSYIFVKAFKKADGGRYYYFTSITVSKDGLEVVISSQEKSRNRLLRLMTEGKMLWRTPKDATTASVEQQGLDYAQPVETETATKGSGVTPQSNILSTGKDSNVSGIKQDGIEKVSGKESSAMNNRMDTADTSKGKRNDTATPQDTASEDKSSNSTSRKQEKSKKVSDTQEEKSKEALDKPEATEGKGYAKKTDVPSGEAGRISKTSMLLDDETKVLIEKRLEEQGDVVPAMDVKKYDVVDFVETDREMLIAHQVLGGVYHDGGFVVGTDGHALFAKKQAYHKGFEGSVMDKKGHEIGRKYPSWRSIIPEDRNLRPLPVDVDALRGFVGSVANRLKEDGVKAKMQAEKYICIIIGNELLAYNYIAFRKFLSAVGQLGVNEIGISQEGYSPLCAKSDKGIAMVVPYILQSLPPTDNCYFYVEDRGDAGAEVVSTSRYTVSDVETRGGKFYQDENGNINLAAIPQEVFDAMDIAPAPFRMTTSMAEHVFEQHGKELKLHDVAEAVDFVVNIMTNFDHVRKGDDAVSFVFSIENGRRKVGKRAITIIVNANNGEFLGIRTSGNEGVAALRKRELLWEKGANETSAAGSAPANVTSASTQQGGEPTSSASNQSNSLSGSKDSNVSVIKQDGIEKVSGKETITQTRQSGDKPSADEIFSEDPSQGDVFVVDQVNRDGSFDEHKVMYGFPDAESARKAYLSNYEDGRQGFEARYYISPKPYTTKRGRTLDMQLLKFPNELTKEQQRAAASLARDMKGWWSKEDNGFMLRSVEHAEQIVKTILDEEAVQDAQPLSVEDVKAVNDQAGVQAVDEAIKVEPKEQTTPQYDTDRDDALAAHGVKLGDKIMYKGKVAIIHDADSKQVTLDTGMAPVLYETTDWKNVELPNSINANARFIATHKEALDALTKKALSIKGLVSSMRKKGAMSLTHNTLRELLDHEAAREINETGKIGKFGQLYNALEYSREIGFSIVTSHALPALEAEYDRITSQEKQSAKDTKETLVNEQQQEESTEQPKQEEKKAKSKWVDDADAERFEELRRRLRMKLGGQLNMGLDPEAFAIGVEMSYLMLKHGARRFGEFAKQMIEALGENVRPYLKAFYNGARDLPEMAGYEKDMTSYDEVRTFDVMNFDKEGAKDIIATAEHIVREQAAEREAKEATNKLKQERNAQRKEIEQQVAAENAGNQQENPSKERKSKKKSVSLQEQTIPDLSSGLFGEEDNSLEPQNKRDDGLQRIHAVRSEGLPAGGNQQGEHIGRQGERSGQGGEGTDRRGESGSVRSIGRPVGHVSRLGYSAADPQSTRPAKPEPAPLAESERKNTHNNHAERGTDYAPKGASARIEANMKAIETMQRLIESGEPAAPEDMSVLRKFSGWGGLGAAFKEKVSSGDSGYNARLRELLSPEAYEAANMSRNSAYYTPAPVIDAMWYVARAMGFRGGNVLEGSAGIGNIIGLMPTDMSERSNIHAVEIDETTGNILSLLYPDANVEVKGFEKTFVPNGSVDLAITNVPFVTGLRVMDETGDKDLSRKFHDIHDFCIAKNVRKLKEGGVGIFITSSGTLDSPNSAKLRTWLVNEGGADVVGAFRMHNQTFGGTGATSDIIVIRKRVNGRKSANAIDVSGTLPIRTVKYNTGETKRGSSEVVIKDLALDVNKHFVEHPEDMAGEMAFAFEKGDTYRATSKALYPSPSINQEQRLSEWAQQFKDMDWDKAEERESRQVVYEDLGEDVKEGSMLLDGDGNLCLAQRGKAVPINVNANKVKGHTKAACFNAYKAIKDALADVLEYQTTHSDDSGLQQRLAKLNKAYDSFVKTYGHLNKNTSISFLRSDMDYPGIAALESVSDTGDKSGKRIVTYGKTDIFSRRVVETGSEPKPTTIKDGIIASIYLNGRVDVPYIAEQLNMSDSDVRQQIIGSGLGFENPTTTEMEVSYEYLSGNVREKLRQAQENNTDGRYDANIKALERVIPMNIPAHLIEFTLGSSWVEPKLYEDFVKERTGLDVKLANAGGTWIMSEPYYTNTEQNKAMGVISEKCDKTILGHELIKAAITCKSISVTKTISTGFGSSKTTETIVDKEATMACANKIDEIRQDFKDWARGKMQGDPEMSEGMERVYNELFNNSVPKEIPDDFVPEHFGGAATVVDGEPFKLYPYQAKAVIRATTQPLMLAHEVGTGKTCTLISTAMEMRRLGTARKPMIVVQNATLGQFVASAKALYPNAKILTLEDADRNAEGRRNFYAKIRYNDWDMIVVPQSVFEMIPDSEERQIRFVEDKVEEKMMVLEKMREAANDDRDPVLRQARRELDQLNDELNDLKLALQERKAGGKTEKDEKREAKTRQNAMVKAQEMLDRETDDVANFDDMGIDALLIDEAHEYKHLGFATAMQRGVKGVDPSYSKKSQGVYLKSQAVLENKNGKNVVFATGTPISNTAAEIWTFMRYLMPADTMREYGIYYFDDFVRNFGNIQQMLEFATNGKYRENNRFAGYVNLPELVRIWAGVADTVLTREAGGVSDKIPKMEGEKAQDIYLPQTKALRGVMKFVKDQLDDYEKMSGKEKKENSHIPLTMYGIAQSAAVDPRLVLEDAADEPNSKTNEAVRQTLRSLEDTKEYNGTVAIFADNYQNKATGFNLYEDIRRKLIDAGVPEAQVVVMKPGMSIKKKLEIFDKVNRGEVRVIMGSTITLGTGVNIQERLHTLIHVDAPNRPMDYTQRNGRILRQGNLHNEWGIPVRVLRFGVEDSLDVTAYQRLKTKGAIADSIMEGKKMMGNSMENRVLEEEQDLFGDITAQLSGSQYALLKNQVEKEVKKLEARKKQWEADQTYVHNQKPRLKALIKDSEERAKRNKEALARVEAAKNDGITIGKMKFPSLDAMTDYLKDYNSKQREQQEQVRTASGYKSEAKSDLTVSVGGFDFHVHRVISKEQKQEKGQLSLSFFSKTQMTYSCPELGLEDVPVDGQRLKSALEDILENVLSGDDFREKAEYAEGAAERYKGELQQVEARDGKPFEYADELKQAKEKLAEYEELMKAEMAEKEAKYAEMDASVEAAKGVQLSDEDSDDAEPLAEYKGVKQMKSHDGVAEEVGERERMVVEAMADRLRAMGIETITDIEEAQRVLDEANGGASLSAKKRRALETVSLSPMEKGQQTVISSADGAKILKDLDILANNYVISASTREKTFLGSLSVALGAHRHGSASEYATFETKNGRLVTIRLSNHNAKVSTFDNHGEEEGISIVVSPKKSGGMANDGNAHVVEYYYDAIKLRRADGKPLAAIVRSIRQALYSGEYKDTTGLAEVQEVNGRDMDDALGSRPWYFRTADGVAYGFTLGGKIYIDPRIATSETPVHEYVHLWSEALGRANPEAWTHLKAELANDEELVGFVRSLYPELTDENALMHEVFSHFAGRRGRARLDAERAFAFERADGLFDKARIVTMFERLKTLLSRYWSMARGLFAGSNAKLEEMSAEDFADMTMADFMHGFNPAEDGSAKMEDNLLFRIDDEVNEQFNEELQRYANGEMGKNEMLHLGRPQGVMRTFLPNLPIVMRQRVIKKGSEKKHEVDVSAIMNMPQHLSSPIFVFQRSEDTIGVLTDMRDRNGKNVCVAIELKRQIQHSAKYLEVNDVRSFHGREFKNIVEPIANNRTLKWVDKEKGLAYLSSASQPVQQEIDKQVLDTATKVVKDFVNPNIGEDFYARSGDGAYNDADLSLMHDPLSKMLGRENRGEKQRREFAERERKRMVAWAGRVAGLLHLDNVEIVTDASTLDGKKRDAKGFYSKSTGKITIVIPNHSSTFDVEQTLLHEAVAHYGLRQLFGEHVDTFLDNVFSSAEADVRRRIVELASRNGWDFRTATEEYLASLAEQTNFEDMSADWWMKLKSLFSTMLRKLGLEGFGEVSLSDNELRYILWRSYQNLKEPGRFKSIFAEAEDIVKQRELGVGQYAVSGGSQAEVAEQEAVDGVGGESIEAVNARFNDELSGLTESNADRKIFSLGSPSPILLSAGVEDKPMKLYGNKVVKKMKKHGFSLAELEDLPRAVADPIAVFNNYEREGNRTILTELRSQGRNIMAAITLGKNGVDVDFNIVSSVFGKGESNVADWINKGYLTYVDKEKALNYLHHSERSISEALSSPKLSAATKIVKEFENPSVVGEKVSGDDVLFRDGDPKVLDLVPARDIYERRMRNGFYQTAEAFLDCMKSLEEAMKAVVGKDVNVEDVAGFENAYIGENRLSSTNQTDAEAFARILFNPLLKEVSALAPEKSDQADLIDYMMAKHGLERNAYMRNEAVNNDEDGDRDFAGLTSLTGMDDVYDAEAEAQLMVDEYENGHDTKELWKRVNDVSKAILKKAYECGMMNKETFDKISNMYEFYIPLRGFDEKTSSEAYAYLNHRHSAFNAPIKRAEGRSSKADNPLANLQVMAESTIMQGNRNKLVKQRFLNFVLNHPSDLVSVSDLWVEYDAVTDEWKPVFPDNIDSTDTPDEVEQKMRDFETKMLSLEQQHPDRYKHGQDAVNVPYRIVGSSLREHQVVVKRGGRDYVITVNGSPRLAQALNGKTNPDNDISGSVGKLLSLVGEANRALSMMYTTFQPDFIASNFIRDLGFSNTMVWMKESPRYAFKFNVNYASLPLVKIKYLLEKYRKGTLDMNDEREKMFYQFIMNGGETGFVAMADIEKQKKELDKALRKFGDKIPARAIGESMATWIGEVGRSIELRARFAAFVTSRESGRSLDRSIWDSKEISVNFNKKGAGDKFLGANGQTWLGNFAAGTSGAGRTLFLFWNAALQGTFNNFGKYALRNKAKALASISFAVGLGILVRAMLSGGGDDDDKALYGDIPKHTRRQNLIIRGGKNTWIKIPLSIEYRAFYGLGELLGGAIFDNEQISFDDVAAQFSQLLPVDLLEGASGLWPTIVKPFVDVYNNESWYGSPIWRETPGNSNAPQWTKAYKNTNRHLVKLAEWTNEMTLDKEDRELNKYKKGAIDMNPAAVEYLLKQYTGGFFTFANQLVNLTDVASGNKDFDWRYVPLANRVLMSGGDERNMNMALDEKFFNYLKAYREKADEIRFIKGDLSLSLVKKAALIDKVIKSPEYASMRKTANDYYKLNEAYKKYEALGDTRKAAEVIDSITVLKRKFISEMEEDSRK